ncbi:MAG: response regulator [Chthoniobacterales bacterium]
MVKSRILIVDDDPNLSRLASIILEQSGRYEVMIVNNALCALPTARQFQPEVMLLDVDMPERDGGDLAHEASNDPSLRHIPILFLTGLVSREEAGTKQLECGGARFLAKPVEPAVLLEAVASLLPLGVAT